jgi:Putative quorum-sensing-regulated virulence factor
MILQFGKYKGKDAADVPTDYVKWLERTQTASLRELRAEMRKLGLTTSEDTTVTNMTAGLTPLQLEMMEAGYRHLARQRHPDHGGSNDAMRDLNDAIGRARSGVSVCNGEDEL